MKFFFSNDRKFVVKIGSFSRYYPLSAIECFFEDEPEPEQRDK